MTKKQEEREVGFYINGEKVMSSVVEWSVMKFASTPRGTRKGLFDRYWEGRTVTHVNASLVAPIMPPRGCGASFWTLRRRVTYGGRKGRSAQRRLKTMGILTKALKPQ